MAIIVATTDETLACEECGEPFTETDLYRCDGCGKVMCSECMPEMPDECANEFCDECSK